MALLGERGVGKTSFISRLTDNCLADEEPFVLKVRTFMYVVLLESIALCQKEAFQAETFSTHTNQH